MNNPKQQRALSLTEALMALTLLSVIVGNAIPFTTQFLQKNREQVTTDLLLAALNRARSEAITSNEKVLLCPGVQQCSNSNRWTRGILVFQDTNQNRQLDADERPILSSEIPLGYHWQWRSFRNLPGISFTPHGMTDSQNGTLTLCRDELPVQQLVINISGRVRTGSTTPQAPCR